MLPGPNHLAIYHMLQRGPVAFFFHIVSQEKHLSVDIDISASMDVLSTQISSVPDSNGPRESVGRNLVPQQGFKDNLFTFSSIKSQRDPSNMASWLYPVAPQWSFHFLQDFKNEWSHSSALSWRWMASGNRGREKEIGIQTPRVMWSRHHDPTQYHTGMLFCIISEKHTECQEKVRQERKRRE